MIEWRDATPVRLTESNLMDAGTPGPASFKGSLRTCLRHVTRIDEPVSLGGLLARCGQGGRIFRMVWRLRGSLEVAGCPGDP